MAKRIVEGLWDCKYCGTKGIGGLTKHCPCCGHPQDEGTTFYLGQKKKYLEADLAAQYGQGADWVCPYCNSLNRVRFKFCSNCGAPKDSSEGDYFNNETKRRESEAAKAASSENSGTGAGKSDAAKKAPDPAAVKKRRFIILGVILALFAVILAVFWPRNYNGEVGTVAWAREIDIEAWRTVQESDWSVPDGGRVYDTNWEIHHYVQVLDHYETRTRQVSEQVYDGEEYHTRYSDNGDGTFTEETYSTPRYRTEYHTETYQEPVYRSDPVYQTKYYYDIERWVVDREEESSGADNEPYWPEYTLAENERTGFQGEAYTMSVHVKDKRYSVSLSYDRWKNFHAGDKIEITVSAGKVTKINGEEV